MKLSIPFFWAFGLFCEKAPDLTGSPSAPVLRAAFFAALLLPIFGAGAGAAPDYPAGLALGQSTFHTGSYGIGPSSFTAQQPLAVAAGGGRVYVADTYNNRVLWWNSAAAYTTGRGADGVIGQPDFISTNYNRGLSGAAADTLSYPGAVAVDASGNVWVADGGNNRVLRFSVPCVGSDVSANLALGQPDLVSSFANGSGASVSTNTLYYPQGIAVDTSGNVWVADGINHRVLKFSSTTIAGVILGTAPVADLVLGQADFVSNSSDRGGSVSTNTLSYPSGLAADLSGNIWVADQNSNRVVRYTAPVVNGQDAGLVVGQASFDTGNPGSTRNALFSPVGIALDASGSLWVADQANSRVLKYSSSTILGFSPGTALNADLVLGQADYLSGHANRGGSTGVDTLNYPAGVAVDPSGNVWVADSTNNRVLEFAASSSGSAAVALGQPEMTNNTSAWTTARTMQGPFSVVEGGGRVYVADASSNRVLWWNSSTTYTNGLPADGIIGQPDSASNSPNRGLTVSTDTLFYPSSVAVDSSSNVWVTDYGNNRVLRFPAPATGSDAIADLVLGQADYLSGHANRGGTTAAGTLNTPGTVVVDGSHVWVTDEFNNRVVRYASPFTNGQDADLLLGQAGFTSNASGTTQTTLSGPRSVAAEVSGAVWVSDTGNNRVLKYAVPATGGPADLVLGQTDFISGSANSGGITPTAAGFDYVYGVTVSSAGDVWVADENNNRVVRFTTPTVSGQAADLVLGQPDFVQYSNNRGAALPAENTLSSPLCATLNSSGNLWVADYGNNRALKFAFISVGGGVTLNGAALTGVTLMRTAAGSVVATTSSVTDGSYTFFGVLDGNYTITPSLPGYIFTPASIAVTVSNSNVIGLNFNAAPADSDKPAVYASGGPNGYAEPGKNYPAVIHLTRPSKSGHVTVKIYTQRNARLVKTLEADVTAGTAAVIDWNCRNTDGEMSGSGVYVAVINGAGYNNEKLRIGVLK